MMLSFWICVNSSVDSNASEKHIVSIFRVEVAKLGSGGIYIGLEEGKAEGVGQSTTSNAGGKGPCHLPTRRQNPEEHYHPHCRENLKPHERKHKSPVCFNKL
jgi:hypothetical protein